MKMRDYASLSMINIETLVTAQSHADLWKSYETPTDRDSTLDEDLKAMQAMKKSSTPLVINVRELQASLGSDMQYVFLHHHVRDYSSETYHVFQELVIFHADVAVQISATLIDGILHLSEEACVSDDWHLWNATGSIIPFDQVQSISFPVVA